MGRHAHVRDGHHRLARNVNRRGAIVAHTQGISRGRVPASRIRRFAASKFRRSLFSTTIAGAITATAIAEDDDTRDFLDNYELRRALAAGARTAGHALDVVGLDACLMSMAEVLYQLRGTAGVVVGSEETEPTEGWPYATILRTLDRRPDMTPAQVATVVVRRYIESYKRDAVSQSCSDLAGSPVLATTLERLGTALRAGLAELSTRTAIRRARRAVWHADDPSANVDLIDLCLKFECFCRDPAIQRAAKVLRQVVKRRFVIASESRLASMRDAHGLAIYFPDDTMSPLYPGLDLSRWTAGITFSGSTWSISRADILEVKSVLRIRRDLRLAGVGRRGGLLVDSNGLPIELSIDLGDFRGDVVHLGVDRLDLRRVHVGAPVALVGQHAELVGHLRPEPQEARSLELQLARFNDVFHPVAKLIELGSDAVKNG